MADPCAVCGGEGWVCEDHEDRAWGEGAGCCGAAGMPCKCNTVDPPWHHVAPWERETYRGPMVPPISSIPPSKETSSASRA